ncbi:MAG TPA: L,D-transpeptidase family protein [Mucilaginibacter sp.]
MKTTIKTINSFKAKGIFIFFGVSVLILHFSIHCLAANSSILFKTIFPATTDTSLSMAIFPATTDTSLSMAIQVQLSTQKKDLYYPLSVERLYKQSGYKLLWIAPDTIKTHASEAMLMLDCVLQFGLNYADYHPQYLTYEKLNLLTQKFSKQNDSEKAAFDIMLTDAMITYINHLHYGKLNPGYPADKIDQGGDSGFDAGIILSNALKQKRFDFMKVALGVQPQFTAYKNLQYHMYLLAGLYTGDCYDTPDSVIRKIAINMERLGWINSREQTYIDINIPSYTLQFHQPDTTYRFKVIVGKPQTPTPTLQSTISYFTTAPEWKVPKKIFVKEILPRALKDISYLGNNHYSIYDYKGNYIRVNKVNLLAVRQNPGNYYARQSSGCDNSLGLIVFRFPNVYDIYLHGTPEQKLFKKEERALSHGCIRVEQAEKLAGLLLKNDRAYNQIAVVNKAIAAYQTKTFTLKKSVPIKVTYLTCEVKKGELVIYKDIYNLDKSLEMALYNMGPTLTMKL